MNEKTKNCTERGQEMVNWSGSHPKGPGPSLLPLKQVTPMSHRASSQGRTKESCRGSPVLGANQETMNSAIDREKNTCKEVAEVIKR